MFKRLKHFKCKYKRRGQALVLYALLIPTLLVFAGAGLDLGWYYLTVSRMQNAADAAVMAGAWKMLEDEGTLSDYSNVLLIDFVPPQNLKHPDTGKPVISTRDTTAGDIVAKAYVKHNLSPEDAAWDGNNIVDAYEKKNILTFASNLYGRGKDLDDYGYYFMWHQVILEEDVKHFFLPGWFAPMKAVVQSVAKITHYIEGPDLFSQTLAIAKRNTKASWDHIRAARYQFDGSLYEDAEERNKAKSAAHSAANAVADKRSVLSTGNKYRAGDKHRIEVLRLSGTGGQNASRYGNPFTTKGNTNQQGYDDLFIDWQGDMAKMTKTTGDLDLGVNGTKSDTTKGWSHFYETNKNLSDDTDLQRRIHGIINFEPGDDGKFPYPVRDADFYRNNKVALDELRRIDKEDNHVYVDENGNDLSDPDLIEKIAKDPPDPLYARIESEPVHDGQGFKTDADGNALRDADGEYIRVQGEKGHSVRQIIINLNVPNMKMYPADSEYHGEHSDRPVFFYYTGPEKIDPNSHVRDSLPVILNFNADFRGIFFFPNSPVVINGNGKNFEGYVIAKEFVRLKNYKDDFVYDAINDVYYNCSTLTNYAGEKVKNSSDFQYVEVNGESKYVRKSELALYDEIDVEVNDTAYDSVYYSKDDAGTADELARASGNGKVNYYYTLSKTENTGWIYAGTGWLDRHKALTTTPDGKVTSDKTKATLAEFQSNWKYNNYGNPTDQGVWRVKEILPDDTEGGWLDEKEGYINRFLLKLKGAIETTPPKYVYSTAGELLRAMGGYTQLDATTWKKNDATQYMKLVTTAKVYYVPVGSIVLHDGEEPAVPNAVLVQYYDGNTPKTGYSDLSDNPKKFYLMYQDDINGNPTTDNPMFVDELGNVQYKHKKIGGVEIDKNEDGSVAYETIKSNVNPKDDPALYRRAADEAVTALTAKYGLDTETMSDADRRFYLEKYHETEYKSEVNRIFGAQFPYLLPGGDLADGVQFFKCADFNLASSVFDSFQLIRMTRYSYLNAKGDKRSINNIFTNVDALRTD